jgi:putative nucleotidyltransferase with HDIG domain
MRRHGLSSTLNGDGLGARLRSRTWHPGPVLPGTVSVGMEGFGSLLHLAGRFFGSLWPIEPASAETQWAREQLNEGERALFDRMSRADRRHAIAVAREAERLATTARTALPDGFVTAALLHDVGKVEAGLGTFARALVTVLAIARRRERLLSWRASPSRWRERAACYLAHDRIGAELLAAAGSNDLVVSWAREHHLPSGRWTVEAELGHLLKEADGD